MKGFLFTLYNKKKNVNYWLNDLDRKKIEKNWLVTKSLTKIILIMAYQYLAFRGSDDSNNKGKTEQKFETTVNTKVVNPGNFLSLVNLTVNLDFPVLKEHFSNCPKNATNTSKTIQN